MEAHDRLIVALDVSTHDEAAALVDVLDNVSFFKIGLQLLLAGDLFGLLARMRAARGGRGAVFLDLKIAGDIGNTITEFVRGAGRLGARFINFVEAADAAITTDMLAAGRAARGDAPFPQFLAVPLPSSLGRPSGLGSTADPARGVDGYIVDRGRAMLAAGCDGLVVSGSAIGACRRALPDAVLVSPGVRPAGAAHDDHARSTTPAEAIRLGADYLVVGRPIRNAPDPRGAAQRIIDEIARASGQTPCVRVEA